MATQRVPKKVSDFISYIDDTDDYQLTAVPPPANYTRWNWSAAQSAQWHTYRQKADTLWNAYKNKKLRTSDTTDQMHTHIKTVIAYDHTNHLLDNVANSPNSINTDYEKFHIKRGTSLADTTLTRSAASAQKIPVLTIKKITHEQHQLTVTNPDKPKSKGLPKGIKFAKVYRFVGTVAPTDVSQYQFVTNAKRGLATSSFADADLGKTAWYIARYESSTGILGQPCTPVTAMVA